MKSKTLFALLCLDFFAFLFAIAGVGTAQECHNLGPGKPGFIQLVEDKEPGEPLVLYAKILDEKSNVPVKEASLSLYQANVDGLYKSTFLGLPSYARIRGRVQSDDAGCVMIRTILPGDYPGYKDNRHIHFVLKAKNYKKQLKEFLFDGFLNEPMQAAALRDGSGIILEITKDNEGIWVGTANLLMKRE